MPWKECSVIDERMRFVIRLKDGESMAVPVRFGVPLEKLQPGRYTCQVSVVNPTARKFAVWRAPAILLP